MKGNRGQRGSPARREGVLESLLHPSPSAAWLFLADTLWDSSCRVPRTETDLPPLPLLHTAESQINEGERLGGVRAFSFTH